MSKLSLIVGLGNPGKEYAQTRHNAGAWFVERLAEQYGIMTRAGLHCAPLAHQTAGTLATGTLRFSFGWQTTPEEITWTIHALQELLI